MVRVSTNVSDPIADLLTRIRNSNMVSKDELFVPASKVNEAVLKILEHEGFIGGFERETEDDGVHAAIRVRLKYGAKRERTISGIKRISTPGRRIYARRDKLPRVMGGLGIAILSTSQGVMTDREASKKGIGGEVLAHVW